MFQACKTRSPIQNENPLPSHFPIFKTTSKKNLFIENSHLEHLFPIIITSTIQARKIPSKILF